MYAIRQPRAAGIFYSSDKFHLQSDLEACFNGRDGPKENVSTKVVAVITPHGKQHICGQVCAWSFSRIPKANYLIIGSNQHELGSRFSIMKEGLWKTPMGEVVVSRKVAEKIIDKSNAVDYDIIPHENDHSIEVQIPFLQYRFGNDFQIVPLLVRNRFEDRGFVKQCQEVGKAIAQSLITEKEDWIIVAATDMSRGSKSFVEKSDKAIVDSLKNLSESKFSKAVHDTNSRIPGYGAVMTALAAAKELKAKKSKLLKYSKIQDNISDGKEFSGYASILVY